MLFLGLNFCLRLGLNKTKTKGYRHSNYLDKMVPNDRPALGDRPVLSDRPVLGDRPVPVRKMRLVRKLELMELMGKPRPVLKKKRR